MFPRLIGEVLLCARILGDFVSENVEKKVDVKIDGKKLHNTETMETMARFFDRAIKEIGTRIIEFYGMFHRS